MMRSNSLRPRGYLLWFVLLLVIIAISLAVFYQRQRASLVCAGTGGNDWHLTYVDGDHISKFMWSIKPTDQESFIGCLESEGYGVKRLPDTGEVTAVNDVGRTISNTIGDQYVQTGTFYRW